MEKVNEIPQMWIVWLAGYLEGEGHFGCYNYSLRINATTTDEDIASRVLLLFGKDKFNRVYLPKGGRKVAYSVDVYGAKAQELMLKVYPLMGVRRQKQISDALKQYRPFTGKFE